MKTKPLKKPAKKAAKPASKKALTHRQQFGKGLQEFEIRVNEKLDAFRQALNSVMERMWKNIQLLDNGLHISEAHVVIFRKVMDDALNNILVTKDTTAQKVEVVEGVATTTEIPAVIINWEHYASWFSRERSKEQAAKQAAIDAAKAAASAASPAPGPAPTPETAPEGGNGNQKTAEAKNEEPVAPQDNGVPEGAAIFGGEGA